MAVTDGAQVVSQRTTSKRPNRLFKNMTAKLASIPMIFTALVVFIGCTIWTIYHSFTKSKLLPAPDKWVGLDQYERLWSTRRWLVSIENLAIYGICSLVLSLVIGFTLAALLDRKIRGEGVFRTIFLYPFALSFIVTGLVWQWILNPQFGIQGVIQKWGWESFTFDPLNNADIVIYGILIAGIWQGSGFIMVILLAGLRGIDEDIWKASRVEGIPVWKTYIFIIIPMMRPIFCNRTGSDRRWDHQGLRSCRRTDLWRSRHRLRSSCKIRHRKNVPSSKPWPRLRGLHHDAALGFGCADTMGLSRIRRQAP